MEKNIIYLKDVIKQAKKRFIKDLLDCEDWKEWRYCDLWLDVWKEFIKRFDYMLKRYEYVYVKYGNTKIKFTAYDKIEIVERIMLDKFWGVIHKMEHRLRDKYFDYLEEKLGKYKHPWM